MEVRVRRRVSWFSFLLAVVGLIVGHALLFAQAGMVTGRVKSPLKVQIDLTAANPSSAPTLADGGSGGACSTTSNPFHVAVAYVNNAGRTGISPVGSVTVTANFHKISITFTDTPPSTAAGRLIYFARANESYATWHLAPPFGSSIGPQTLDAGFIPTSTGSGLFTCVSNAAMDVADPPANQTGPVALASINSAGQGVIGVGTQGAGTNVQLWTADSRKLNLSGLIPTLDTGGGPISLQYKPTKMVTICPTAGVCDYTTVTAASSANTSSAANPILFWWGPGLYTSTGETFGTGGTPQVSATLLGAGRGVTVLDGSAGNTVLAVNGSNLMFSGFTVKGPRTMQIGPTGGVFTRTTVREAEFLSDDGTGQQGDCILWTPSAGSPPAAGSEFYVENNLCSYTSDGFTMINDSASSAFSIGNRFAYSTTTSDDNRTDGWVLFNIPCHFHSAGDSFYLTQPITVSHSGGQDLGMHAFLFDGGSGTNDCSGADAYISGDTVFVNDTSANSIGSEAVGIRMSSAATSLVKLNVSASTLEVNVPTDVVSGTPLGISVENATTVATLQAVRVRTTGGTEANRFDLKASASGAIVASATDWLKDNGNVSTAFAPFNTTRLFTQTSVQGGDLINSTTSPTATAFATTIPIPAGVLNQVGRHLHARIAGIGNTTGTPSTVTMTVALDGSTTLASRGAMSQSASSVNLGYWVEIDVTTITTGTSGTVEVQANGSRVTNSLYEMENSATKTVDLTVSHTLGLKVAYATNNGSGENMQQRQAFAWVE